MKRASVAALYGASAASFAVTLGTPPAFGFVALAVLFVAWRPLRIAPAVARRALELVLGATLVYGWVLVIYPVMGAPTMRLWSLVLGYGLGSVGALYLSCAAGAALSIPASIALLAVSSFDRNAGLHPYLIVAACATVVVLASDLRPGRAPLSRPLLIVGSCLLSASVAAGIVLVLPWTQGKVEETMMAVYSPGVGSGDDESRSRLGELRSMKLSSRIVMRVWADRPQRLRARALVRFDGRTWFADPSTVRPLEASPEPAGLDGDGRAFLARLSGSDFVIEPEPLAGRRLVRTRVLRVDGGGLATPGGTRVVKTALDRVQTDASAIVLSPPGESVWRYAVLHDLDHRRVQERAPDAASLAAAVQLPDGLDPRIRELSDELARDAPGPEAIVDRVVSRLRSEYRYSLDIGPPRRSALDPIAQFLFETKRGWCEYFAGSAAILLRVQGIPTRYVRGLNVLGSQKSGDHYVVREWDRHAWIDVYLEGKGWIEYDPTPAAEYESLHAGWENEGALSELFERVKTAFAEGYAWLRTFEWKSLTRPSIFLFAIVALAAVLVRLSGRFRHRERRRAPEERREPTEIERLAHEAEKRLAGLGFARPAHRAPMEHWRSLPEERVPTAFREAGLAVLEAYYRTRFGGRSISPEETGMLRRVLSESLPAS